MITDSNVRHEFKPDRTLIPGVVRANAWRGELLAGKAKTPREIALRGRLPERRLRRVFGPAFLAPGIPLAILDGRRAEDPTLEERVMGGNLPMDRAKQRRRLRMA